MCFIKMLLILTFSILYVTYLDCASVDIRCTEDFCIDDYAKNPCVEVDVDCRNETLALLYPSPTECNCCQHCLKYLDLEDDCTRGSVTNPLPTTMCGPGLTCSVGSKCVSVGSAIKDPDEKLPYTCTNGRCNCISPDDGDNGMIIFGTFEETEDIEESKQCQCSVLAYKALKMQQTLKTQITEYKFEVDYPAFRCLPNGQFDPLQCIEHLCTCVDPETGLIDSTVVPVPVINLNENSLPCFNRTLHMKGKYLKPCEEKRESLIFEIGSALAEDFIVLMSEITACDFAGEYK